MRLFFLHSKWSLKFLLLHKQQQQCLSVVSESSSYGHAWFTDTLFIKLEFSVKLHIQPELCWATVLSALTDQSYVSGDWINRWTSDWWLTGVLLCWNMNSFWTFSGCQTKNHVIPPGNTCLWITCLNLNLWSTSIIWRLSHDLVLLQIQIVGKTNTWMPWKRSEYPFNRFNHKLNQLTDKRLNAWCYGVEKTTWSWTYRKLMLINSFREQ